MITRKTTPAPPTAPTGQAPPGSDAPVARTEAPSAGGQASSDAEVADFVAKMKALAPVAGAGRGRLIFAMDATMSRAPTWDMALKLQGDMFRAVKEVGGLDVQLVYFRGMNECRASKWVSDPDALARLMTSVSCHGGLTQIGKVLAHALDESGKRKVNALVYVGDCMEENVDRLVRARRRAGAARRARLPVPGGRRRQRRACLPRDRPPDQGRLLPLRSRLGAAAARTADRGRRLRRGRPQGLARLERGAPRRRGAPAARATGPAGR